MTNTSPLEHTEAIMFANYLRELQAYGKIIMFAHLVNEFKLGNRYMGLLQSLKAEGWNRGVPDYLIVTKKGVVFIELKRLKGSTVSSEQKQWQDALLSVKVPALVCKGADHAIRELEKYL